jgi:hypothetical protein
MLVTVTPAGQGKQCLILAVVSNGELSMLVATPFSHCGLHRCDSPV